MAILVFRSNTALFRAMGVSPDEAFALTDPMNTMADGDVSDESGADGVVAPFMGLTSPDESGNYILWHESPATKFFDRVLDPLTEIVRAAPANLVEELKREARELTFVPIPFAVMPPVPAAMVAGMGVVAKLALPDFGRASSATTTSRPDESGNYMSSAPPDDAGVSGSVLGMKAADEFATATDLPAFRTRVEADLGKLSDEGQLDYIKYVANGVERDFEKTPSDDIPMLRERLGLASSLAENASSAHGRLLSRGVKIPPWGHGDLSNLFDPLSRVAMDVEARLIDQNALDRQVSRQIADILFYRILKGAPYYDRSDGDLLTTFSQLPDVIERYRALGLQEGMQQAEMLLHNVRQAFKVEKDPFTWALNKIKSEVAKYLVMATRGHGGVDQMVWLGTLKNIISSTGSHGNYRFAAEVFKYYAGLLDSAARVARTEGKPGEFWLPLSDARMDFHSKYLQARRLGIAIGTIEMRHPITGEPVPRERIDRRFIDGLVTEVRRYFREKFQDILKRYAAGEDKNGLVKEIEEDTLLGRSGDAYDFLLEIADWFGRAIGDETGGFLIAMRHRVARPYMAYQGLATYIERNVLDKFLSEGRLNESSEQTDIYSSINDILTTLSGKISEKEINVGFDRKLLQKATVDPSTNFALFEQIAEELIWNAVKYGEHNVKVEWADPTWTLIVTNDGPEIPEGFDPFQQGVRGANTKGIEGIGYGLFTAKEDAESQGWSLTFASRPGETVFRLWMKPASSLSDRGDQESGWDGLADRLIEAGGPIGIVPWLGLFDRLASRVGKAVRDFMDINVDLDEVHLKTTPANILEKTAMNWNGTERFETPISVKESKYGSFDVGGPDGGKILSVTEGSIGDRRIFISIVEPPPVLGEEGEKNIVLSFRDPRNGRLDEDAIIRYTMSDGVLTLNFAAVARPLRGKGLNKLLTYALFQYLGGEADKIFCSTIRSRNSVYPKMAALDDGTGEWQVVTDASLIRYYQEVSGRTVRSIRAKTYKPGVSPLARFTSLMTVYDMEIELEPAVSRHPRESGNDKAPSGHEAPPSERIPGPDGVAAGFSLGMKLMDEFASVADLPAFRVRVEADLAELSDEGRLSYIRQISSEIETLISSSPSEDVPILRARLDLIHRLAGEASSARDRLPADESENPLRGYGGLWNLFNPLAHAAVAIERKLAENNVLDPKVSEQIADVLFDLARKGGLYYDYEDGDPTNIFGQLPDVIARYRLLGLPEKVASAEQILNEVRERFGITEEPAEWAVAWAKGKIDDIIRKLSDEAIDNSLRKSLLETFNTAVASLSSYGNYRFAAEVFKYYARSLNTAADTAEAENKPDEFLKPLSDAGSYFHGKYLEARRLGIAIGTVEMLHPITGEPVPRESLDRRFIEGLVRDVRAYFKERIRDVLQRYRTGGDREGLIKEIEADTVHGKARTVINYFGEIAIWFGLINGDAKHHFASAMVHRVSRPFNGYKDLANLIKRDEVEQGVAARGLDGRPTEAKLEKILFDIASMLRKAILERGVLIDYDIEAIKTVKLGGLIDLDLFEQIAEELIWNAVKYGEHNVRVSWDDATWTLIVTNDGPGLIEGFDPFQPGERAPSVAGIEGTGYGLSNAHEDAESQGWSLTFTSHPGETVFRLRMKPENVGEGLRPLPELGRPQKGDSQNGRKADAPRLTDLISADDATFAAAVERMKGASEDEALDVAAQLGDMADEIVRRHAERLAAPGVDAEVVSAVARDLKMAYRQRWRMVVEAIEPSVFAKQHNIWSAFYSSACQALEGLSSHLSVLNDEIKLGGFDSDSVKEWLERARRTADTAKHPVLENRGYEVAGSRRELAGGLLGDIGFREAEKRWDGDDIVFSAPAGSKIDGSLMGIEVSSWSEAVPNDLALKTYLKVLGWTMKVTPVADGTFDVHINFGGGGKALGAEDDLVRDYETVTNI